MFKNDKEELLDICWELFQNQIDTKDDAIIKACVDLVRNHRFDVDYLPMELHTEVKRKVQLLGKEDYYSSMDEHEILNGDDR